eukprot:2781548-Pyramimonas_sp.AAC.2
MGLYGHTTQGPQHRLQTANQGVQYIKGVHGVTWGVCKTCRTSSAATAHPAGPRCSESLNRNIPHPPTNR